MVSRILIDRAKQDLCFRPSFRHFVCLPALPKTSIFGICLSKRLYRLSWFVIWMFPNPRPSGVDYKYSFSICIFKTHKEIKVSLGVSFFPRAYCGLTVSQFETKLRPRWGWKIVCSSKVISLDFSVSLALSSQKWRKLK